VSKETSSNVTFTLPDFLDSDGVSYTEIQVIVEIEGGDIRDTVQFAKTLERPLAKRRRDE
jgi:hypothetical protein